MTFSVCLHCRRVDSSYRFDTCNCTQNDDETPDEVFHGS